MDIDLTYISNVILRIRLGMSASLAHNITVAYANY